MFRKAFEEAVKDIGMVSRSSQEVFIEYKFFLNFLSLFLFFLCLFIVFVIFFLLLIFFFAQYVSLLVSNGSFLVLIRSISKNFRVG